MQFKQMHTSNFGKGRLTYRPEAIIIHITEGSSESAIKWCHDQKSKVSYHYIVREDGSIIELVRPENTAWHAGLIKNPSWQKIKKNINPNLYTIGLAFAGHSTEGPNFMQFCSMVLLVKKLCTDYKIKVDTENIVGHNEIRSDKTCPSEFVSTHAIASAAILRSSV